MSDEFDPAKTDDKDTNGGARGGGDGGEEVQDQRTHMPIKKFLKTFLCQNFLKKRADCKPQIVEKALRVEYLKLPLQKTYFLKKTKKRY